MNNEHEKAIFKIITGPISIHSCKLVWINLDKTKYTLQLDCDFVRKLRKWHFSEKLILISSSSLQYRLQNNIKHAMNMIFNPRLPKVFSVTHLPKGGWGGYHPR